MSDNTKKKRFSRALTKKYEIFKFHEDLLRKKENNLFNYNLIFNKFFI
jgi:hypothetical protein